MDSSEELKNEGWHISIDGYDLITENKTVKDKKSIVSNALNTDIKEFGESILNSEIKQNKTGKIKFRGIRLLKSIHSIPHIPSICDINSNDVILQIQKIRNVAAPKAKEESQVAPRMLKLILTDGHTSCQAVEIINIPSLSRIHIAPGSKLLISHAKIFSSCILLHPKCCTLLGGRVPALYEKWEMAKNISEHVRSSVGTDGAPPWVNFGEKVIPASNEPFKSLIDKTTKETSNEFDVQRQDAIAVASTGAVKKVFGGGVINQVINQRYSSGRGSYENRNNQETNREPARGYRGKREPREKVVEKSQKPPEKISLFDFLENKLLVNETDVKAYSKGADDNNFSKSEVQRSSGQRRDVGRNFSDSHSPRFQQQKYPGSNTSKPFVNNYARQPKSNRDVMTTSRNSENVSNSISTTDPVDSISRNLGRMSVNSQFASRSLQQHLNLGNKNEFVKSKVNSSPGGWNWKIGDLCMAKYWEDGKYYNASITNLTERTCVVQFNGYGNVEEVLKVDCIPITDHHQDMHFNPAGNHKGSMGFRSNRRPYSNNRPFNKAT